MSGTSSTSPTAAWVDATGIHAPTYADIVAYLSEQFQAIYGSDIVITPDSQDGQLIGIIALAIADTNNACIAAYNAFSPATAQGVGLSSNVKINGLQRQTSTNGSVDLLITGVTGTTISNGVAQDDQNNQWVLPVSVTIPYTGQITVTATAAQPGVVVALPNTITTITTVTRGWQLVTNPDAATVGAPLETDPALRQRQAKSTSLPALTVLSGIVGAVLALDGVTYCMGYENDTSIDYTQTPPPPGESPLPPHSISLVVNGGDATEICQTILLKKTPGCYTYGTTRVTVDDIYNLPHDIGFFRPTIAQVGVAITLTAKIGYSTLIGNAISQAVADYINGLGAGVQVVYSKLWLPANLCDALTGLPTGATNTYDITAMTDGIPPGGTYGTANIPNATTNPQFNIFTMPQCNASDVVITVS